MNNFGKIKSKVLAKLVESYSSDKKNDLKDILKTIKENNDFKEMYLFYEEIENKYFDDKETAKLYVEELNKILKDKSKSLKPFCEDLDKKLGDVNIFENSLYSVIDQLLEDDNLSNIDKKVIAKKKLVEHLTTKKEETKTENINYIQNESLLHAVLANNFNITYDSNLSEEQRQELKNILSMSNNELELKTNELKESLQGKIESLLNESNDEDLKTKLEKVKEEVNSKTVSRLNFYRLSELKNGLN